MIRYIMKNGKKVFMVTDHPYGEGFYQVHRFNNRGNTVNLGINISRAALREIEDWTMRSHDLRWSAVRPMVSKWEKIR